jgi:hypothetical protein
MIIMQNKDEPTKTNARCIFATQQTIINEINDATVPQKSQSEIGVILLK